MPDKFLLDANALLNAAFIPQSWSRLAIDIARSFNASIYVGTATLQEAMAAAARIAKELGKRTDPRPIVDGYVQQIRGIHIVADSAVPVPREVPTSDSLVFKEAHTSGAELLTSDAELWLACRKTTPSAVLPLQVIRRYNGVSLPNTIFGVTPTRDSGSLFFRMYPGAWAGMGTPERFTAIHFPGEALWLYYETGTRRWVAELASYEPIKIGIEVEQGRLQTVGLSWRLGAQIALRVDGVDHPEVLRMERPLPDNVEGNVQIGGHPSGRHYWNGHIYVCVNDDRPIGTDGWRALKKDRDLTPNPFDSDRLMSVMNKVLA